MTILLVVLALVYLLGGIDDLFMDAVYYVSLLVRRFGGSDPQHVDEAAMHNTPQQRVAILVPAWDESAVIARMLESTNQLLDYSNFDIFVGTYPNDPATQLEVERMALRFPNVHSVVTPNHGPTSKADCLNWVVEGIRLYEKQQGTHFDIFVMQDAEDFVHPLSLKLYNCLIPRFDMVQTPVLPFERPWHSFISNSYLDEFAESHLKTLVARQIVGGMVPSAGVGTGFSREACDELAEQTNHQLFNPMSLTEDYDFGFRLFALGHKSIISNTWVERVRTEKKQGDEKQRLTAFKELMATREYFPSKFKQATKQKCRWTIGIVFQGWQFIGWKGSLREKYMLYRDRKGLITTSLNLLSYSLVVFSVLFFAVTALLSRDHHGFWLLSWPRINAWPWLFYANMVLLLNRLLQRALCVWRVTNWRQALLSVPGLMVSNVVDLTATIMATRQYVRSRKNNVPLRWVKTAHAYPSEEILLSQKRKLGDLLLARRIITPIDLMGALERQAESGLQLGQILVELELISKPQLEEMLAMQLNTTSVEMHREYPEVELMSDEEGLEAGMEPSEDEADLMMLPLEAVSQ